MRTFIIITFLFLVVQESFGQRIENVELLSSLINPARKNLVIVGEEHTSAANPKITFELITYLHENYHLRNLLIEFGPSEAYLYNRFLHSGDESYLEKTIYAGVFNEWKEFYLKLHKFNGKLPVEDRIIIVGIDFERPQVFAHAFNRMVEENQYESEYLDSLNRTFNEDFYKKHTNRFPSDNDKLFMNSIRLSLQSGIDKIKELQDQDYEFLKATMNNKVHGFAGNREEELKDNVIRILEENNSSIHLLLIGQGHVNYKNENIGYLLKNDPALNIIAGKILYHNSQQWKKGFKKLQVINELKNNPWKKYRNLLKQKIVSDSQFNLILIDEFPELRQMYDFIIIANNQDGLSFE